MSNEEIAVDSELVDDTVSLGGVATSRGILRLFPTLFAIVATFLFWLYVGTFIDTSGFMYSLFLPGGEFFEQLIPMAIMFLLFWVLGDIAIKFWTINREYQSLSHDAIRRTPLRVGRSEIDEAVRELRDASGDHRTGYVFRAVESLLRHLGTAKDSQRSHEYFRHQIDLDAETISSNYTVVRVFIWAMPILGFIGTVVGISVAVGDFSGFLSGDIDDIELVKQELANVSNGLSFAFNTTLLGLVASLVAMLLTTWVQRRNELLTRGVEELGLRVIASIKQDQAMGAPDVDSGMLIESMQAFADVVGRESERLRSGFDTFNNRFLDVGSKIVDTYSGLGTSLEKQTAASTQQMKESTSHLANALTDASSAFFESTAAISRDLESFSPDLGLMRKAVADSLDRVEQYNHQFEEVLRVNNQKLVESQEQLGVKIIEGIGRMDRSNSQFEEALRANAQQVAGSQEKLGEKIAEGLGQVDQSSRLLEGILRSNAEQMATSHEQLAGKISEGLGQLERSNHHFEGVLLSNAQQVITSQDKLGEKMESIRPTHEMIVKVTQSIDNSNGALEQMKEVHKTLLPVLQELRGPMEFKMVPAASKAPRDAD